MKKAYDLTGNKYSEIIVVKRDFEKEKNRNDRKTYWECLCRCGNVFSTTSSNLKSGNTKSCGCNNGGKGKSKNGKQNEWIIEDNSAIGITFDGYKFYIDLEDLDKVKKYCWRLDKKGYIVANSKDLTNTTIWIHRVVMNPTDLELVDHIDWDKSDNRKANLRIATKSQNNVNIKKKSNNTSGYTGVKQTPNGKWIAQVSFNNKRIHLGTFETIEEAILIRSRAEKIIHRDFNGEINRKDFMNMIAD